MSKETIKKRIVDLRAALAREREAKKRDNASYANMIKGASSPSGKASYRKSKIDRAAAHDRNINRLQEQIASARLELARAK